MSLTPAEIRTLRGPVEGRWKPYFTTHGDPFVVPADDHPVPLNHRIADVSSAPADYGRDNARLLAAAPDLADTALALYERNEALEAWKREAIEVIEAWERVHEALGKPGPLGESKAVATLVEVASRRAVVRALAESDPMTFAGQGDTPWCGLCDRLEQESHAPSCPWRQARELTEGEDR